MTVNHTATWSGQVCLEEGTLQRETAVVLQVEIHSSIHLARQDEAPRPETVQIIRNTARLEEGLDEGLHC